MPPVVYRDLGYVGIAKQASQGTGAAPTKFLKFTNSALLPDQKIQDYRNGNVRDYTFSLKETLQNAGTVQAFMYADEGAALLAWCFGQDTITGAGDPYSHTITLADPPPFLSVEAEYAEGQVVDRFTDSRISKLTIAGEAAKPIFLTPDFVGAGLAFQGSAATVTFNDGAGQGPFTFLDSVFTITGPTDASTLALQVHKFEITVDQHDEPIYGPGSLTPIFVLPTARDVMLKASIYLSGPALYELVYYGSSVGTSPSRIIGTGSFEIKATVQNSPERSFDITLPNINWTMAKPNISPDAKPTLYEITATAIRSGATLPISAIVKNGVSTSYTA